MFRTRGIIAPLFVTLLIVAVSIYKTKSVHGQSTIVHTFNGTYQFHHLRQPTGIIAQNTPLNGIELFIADTGNNLIRESTAGVLSTIAGNGTAGYVDGTPPRSAEFNKPTGLVGGRSSINFHGTEYSWYDLRVLDTNNHVVRRVCGGTPPPGFPPCPSGVNTVGTAAGTGARGFVNGSNATAEFAFPSGITFANGTSYYLADSANNVIRSWDSSTVGSYAGDGTPGYVDGPKALAEFDIPTKVISDPSGNLLVVDAGNHSIRKIDTSGNVTTFAGNGTPGFADGGPSVARFNRPLSMVYDSTDGFYYIADTGNNCIRRMDSSGNVSTYAGTNIAGYVNGSLSVSRFNNPTDLSIVNQVMYLTDSTNNSIRRIDMTAGTVTTLLN